MLVAGWMKEQQFSTSFEDDREKEKEYEFNEECEIL
jgi:hypothetical protein